VPYRFDATTLPLLRITFAGSVDDDAFRAYLGEYRAVLSQGKPYAVLLDASDAGVPSSAQRKLQADFIRDNAVVMGAVCVGGAFIIQSTLVRGALTAILWLQPMPFRHVVVGTVAEGEAWCRGRLTAAGIS
jgi:hypothetical protein